MLFILWHFRTYGPLTNFYVVIQRLYFFLQDVANAKLNVEEKSTTTTNTEEQPVEIKKPLVKYEDKYLEDIRKMSKEYEFTEAEKNVMSEYCSKKVVCGKNLLSGYTYTSLFADYCNFYLSWISHLVFYFL